MRVAVASGKGGTGKTLMATNLAWSLAARTAGVAYVDTDVEAPNGHLFFQPEVTWTERHAVPVPTLDEEFCSGCGECAAACQFGAIVAGGQAVTVYPDLCHSCGVCVRACPERSLREQERETGTLRRGHAGPMGFIDGVLDVGEVRAVPLIQAAVKESAWSALAVLDAPPGTSCSAVAALEDADLVILVCEPTPFGLHDLELSLQMCEALGLETAAVVNRSDVGDGRVRAFLAAHEVPVLAEVPFDREIATACATGVLASTRVATFASTVDRLADHLLERFEPCLP
ncbi:MAG: ATP-binding protein [Acidobacteria bacterium]|jgi:MinD superfamily P-loop ATPase|nr:ATP-binding protein [Acidobacteriota bacterium]